MERKRNFKSIKTAALLLTSLTLCAAVFAGVYAKANMSGSVNLSENVNASGNANPSGNANMQQVTSGLPETGSDSDSNTLSKRNYWDILMKELPHETHFDSVPVNNNLKTGIYLLNSGELYPYTANWEGASDILTIQLVGRDGSKKEYTLANGETALLRVPNDGEYYIGSPSGRDTGDMFNFNATLNPAEQSPDEPSSAKQTEQFSSQANKDNSSYIKTDTPVRINSSLSPALCAGERNSGSVAYDEVK